MCHPLLLRKLERANLGKKVFIWIASYLSQRRQCVILNGTTSTVEVTSGVPQGSVLGPLVFVYINDTPDGISSRVRLFADDSAVYKKK